MVLIWINKGRALPHIVVKKMVHWPRRRLRGAAEMIRKLSFSREWQDWCNLLLGIWLCVSPWVLRFVDDRAAAENAVFVGFLIILAEVFTLSMLRAVEE